ASQPAAPGSSPGWNRASAQRCSPWGEGLLPLVRIHDAPMIGDFLQEIEDLARRVVTRRLELAASRIADRTAVGGKEHRERNSVDRRDAELACDGGVLVERAHVDVDPLELRVRVFAPGRVLEIR